MRNRLFVRLRLPGASLALLLGLVAPTAADTTPVPEASRFGVNDDHILTSPEALQQVKDAGFGWVHYLLYWNFVNPAPGVYDWSAPDLEIQRLADLGLNVYVRIAFPPTWTTGASYPNTQVPYFCLDESAPNDLKAHPDCGNPERRPGFGTPPGGDRSQDFRTFVDAAVNRYKDRVRAWGFGSEAHSRVFWQGTLEQFFDEILRPGYETVKAIDPALLVVGPDEDLPDPFAQLVNLETTRGVTAFDVLSYHVLRHSGWASITDVDDVLEPLVASVRRGRPFWISELGFRSAGLNLDDQVQAAWLVDEMLRNIAARAWIDKTFIYRLKDAVAEDFGILHEDDSPKPAYDQLKQFVGAQAIPRFYYLAEGATKSLFDLEIAVANPNLAAAPVKISFLKADGTVILLTPTLEPRSRTTVRVDTIAGLESADVSTIVESTSGLPLAIERTMFWDAGMYGGHTDTAVQAPAERWYFAEGSQGFFDTYILLANSSIVPAQVTVTFALQGAGPVQKSMTIGATSRGGFCTCEFPELHGQSFGLVVESDRPIIAERAMYFGGSPFWSAGHESAGVTAAATSWFLAEGRTGPMFDLWVLVSNPNEDKALVDLEFVTSNGQTVLFPGNPLALAGRSRESIWVDGVPGLEDIAVSTRVTSDLPVVVERAMYWPGSPVEWYEAHNSFGLTETGTRWALAEGRAGHGGRPGTNPAFETYILVYNTSDTPANVSVTYLLDGEPAFTVAQVMGKGRTDVVDGLIDPRLANRSFGALIESDQPIVVERAMYWRGSPNRPWGWGGSNATAVKLP
jgi:hypothetical protein